MDLNSDMAREGKIGWRDSVEEGGADSVAEEGEVEVIEGLLLEIRTGERVGDEAGQYSISDKESRADQDGSYARRSVFYCEIHVPYRTHPGGCVMEVQRHLSIRDTVHVILPERLERAPLSLPNACCYTILCFTDHAICNKMVRKPCLMFI